VFEFEPLATRSPPIIPSLFPRLLAAFFPKPDTILAMDLAILGIRLLETMFFVGLVGSSVVVVISFIEDGKELFGDE
jgi:hypothetical protein